MSTLTLGTSFLSNTDFKLNKAVDTGATFGGKKVYAKMIEITYSSTSGASKDIPHGISIDDYGYYQILDIIGMTPDTSPRFYPLNFYNGTVWAYCTANRTNITVATTQSLLLGRGCYVLIIFSKG